MFLLDGVNERLRDIIFAPTPHLLLLRVFACVDQHFTTTILIACLTVNHTLQDEYSYDFHFNTMEEMGYTLYDDDLPEESKRLASVSVPTEQRFGNIKLIRTVAQDHQNRRPGLLTISITGDGLWRASLKADISLLTIS